MINVTEEISRLTQQENQLHTSLDDLRGQRSKVKEYKQVEKELATVLHKNQNLQAWAVFEVGMPVYRLDSNRLGIVKGKNTTPGGMREIWVSWDGTIEIPEQPNLLQIDGAAMAKIILVGDHIEIRDGHEEAGKTFTVERLLARGAVETTEEIVFERQEWQKVEKAFQEPLETENKRDEDSIDSASFSQEPQIITESREELGSETPETTVTVNTTATQIDELTEEEERERHRLESKVERAFYEAGSALRQLRDGRLYRSTHKTFEDYCQDRFRFQRRHCYQLIEAAGVVDNLCAIGAQILPTNERQVRFLTKLEPIDQCSTWQKAVEMADGRVPNGKIVKGIIEQLENKSLTLANDFCQIGDAFIVARLEGSDRKYNGCWAIALELRDFTIAVDVHDTTLTVKPDNLRPIDFPDARRQLPETLKRIRRLRDCGLLDRCAYTILESLGRQVYLTDFEEAALQCLENYYGIES